MPDNNRNGWRGKVTEQIDELCRKVDGLDDRIGLLTKSLSDPKEGVLCALVRHDERIGVIERAQRAIIAIGGAALGSIITLLLYQMLGK